MQNKDPGRKPARGKFISYLKFLFVAELDVFLMAQVDVFLRRFAVGDERGEVLEVAEGDDGFAADLGRVRHAVDTVGRDARPRA